MIPGVRHRATRRRSTGVVTFDNSTVVEGASTTSFNLTVGAGATLIVFAAGNLTTGATVDGVPMTLIGKTSNAAMYAATGLPAGSRAVQVGRDAATGYIVSAVSYTGAATVSAGVMTSGSGLTAAVTPPGGGTRAVVGFDFAASSTDFTNAATDGSTRVKYRRVNGNNVMVADKPSAPVTATFTGTPNWTAIGVWLS